MTPAKMLIMMGFRPKNELVYNPITWVGWSLGANVVGDSTGLELIAINGSFVDAIINTTLKSSTKYGLLYKVVSSTLAGNFSTNDYHSAFPASGLSKTVGYNKSIITTIANITYNKLDVYISSGETTGNKIKITEVRLFELPTGSQIETDFTNLTAAQLNGIYPY